jgi:hypothetical protein
MAQVSVSTAINVEILSVAVDQLAKDLTSINRFGSELETD